jgi:HlyD family secretion protein
VHRRLAALLLLGACDPAGTADAAPELAGHQGIVELEERTLALDVAGLVATVHVRAGDVLAAQQKLLELDATLVNFDVQGREAEVRAVKAELDLLLAGSRPEAVRTIQADLAAARSERQVAERQLARQKQLAASGALGVAELDGAEAAVAAILGRVGHLEQQLRLAQAGARSQEVDRAAARLEAAQAALLAARERSTRHQLEAGAAGVVLDVHVDPGEFVPLGAPLVTVADVSRPYVDVFVPEGFLANVVLGGAAEVRSDGVPGVLRGRVEHVGRHMEFTPRFLFSPRERANLVVRVRVRIDDPEGVLRAGIPAFVTFAGAAS